MGSNTVNVGPSDFYKVKSFYRIRDKSRERKARALADWTGKPRLLSDFRFLFLHLACGFSGVGVKSGLQPEESLTAGWTICYLRFAPWALDQLELPQFSGGPPESPRIPGTRLGAGSPRPRDSPKNEAPGPQLWWQIPSVL